MESSQLFSRLILDVFMPLMAAFLLSCLCYGAGVLIKLNRTCPTYSERLCALLVCRSLCIGLEPKPRVQKFRGNTLPFCKIRLFGVRKSAARRYRLFFN